MAVHVFIVECAADLQGLDLDWVRYDLRGYLVEQRQFGSCPEPLTANSTASLREALERFVSASSGLPSDDIVILWLSVHGKRPAEPHLLGTSGQIGSEEVEWYEAVSSCVGRWHPKTVIILDVCWGGSPTFPRTVGPGPMFIFGATREGRRIELDAAAKLVIGRAGKDGSIPHTDARAIVDLLNVAFPPNAAKGVPFYRMWWWDHALKWQRYPDPFA